MTDECKEAMRLLMDLRTQENNPLLTREEAEALVEAFCRRGKG